jgi:hypothetical protein
MQEIFDVTVLGLLDAYLVLKGVSTMNRNTLLFLGLGVGAYFFLKSRQAAFILNPATNTYVPATILDAMTVAVTGQPPPPPPSPQQSFSISSPGFSASYGPGGVQLQVQ